MLSYPSGMSVSNRALTMLAEALRHERRARRTRWRRLEAGQQALLVLAYLRKGETYTDLAIGIGVTTVFRYIREALHVLAARTPTLEQAVALARRKRSSSSTAPCCASTESAWPRGEIARSTRENTSGTA